MEKTNNSVNFNFYQLHFKKTISCVKPIKSCLPSSTDTWLILAYFALSLFISQHWCMHAG